MKKLALLPLTLIFLPWRVAASGLLPACAKEGNCGLDDGFQVLVTIAEWGLGLLGAVVLLFFIYGGFVWLTSGGSSEKITKGKSILLNTLFGMLIVLGSWLIVNTILSSVASNQYNSLDKINQQQGTTTTNECADKQEGNPCANGVGVCAPSSGGTLTCVSACGRTDQTLGGTCKPVSECDTTSYTTKPGNCLGDSTILCCVPNP
ncbi:MAG: pilin [Candidatus Komeilibacteria bacterium]|nr:pilin [Candidatus Komeilibacteria bacterium]